MASGIIKKGQFVEIDFTAKIKQSGIIFDTSIREEAKKANFPLEKVKPLIVCIGEGMILKGFDNVLDGKEIGKEYSIELPPKEAFGLRDPKLIRIIPINIFKSKGVIPYPGLVLNMDNRVARISAVSGGRVITDFNNPLAGKNLDYKFKIKRKVIDEKEKAEALFKFFLHLEKPNFEIRDDKVVLKSPKPLENFINTFKPKFKEIMGKDLEFKEEEKKEEKEDKKSSQ